jgi:hypothetical protein
MIPYEDLVAALTNWRARQGLPVQGGGAPPIAATPSPRTAPPAAAPGAAPAPAYDPYAADALDVDSDALLEEEQYDNEGADYAMGFGGQHTDEATAIGNPPSRDTLPETDPDDVPPPPPRRRR